MMFLRRLWDLVNRRRLERELVQDCGSIAS